MCKNVFHTEPCNCDNSLNLCGASDETKFKSNYHGILTKDAAWQEHKQQQKKQELKKKGIRITGDGRFEQF